MFVAKLLVLTICGMFWDSAPTMSLLHWPFVGHTVHQQCHYCTIYGAFLVVQCTDLLWDVLGRAVHQQCHRAICGTFGSCSASTRSWPMDYHAAAWLNMTPMDTIMTPMVTIMTPMVTIQCPMGVHVLQPTDTHDIDTSQLSVNSVYNGMK